MLNAWMAGDGTAFPSLLSGDIEWTIAGNSLAAGTTRGRAELMAKVLTPFGARFVRSSDRFRPRRINGVYADGDIVVAHFDAAGIANDGKPYSNSYVWLLNLLFREVERELFPLAQEDGIAVIPFNPLAEGLLSGRYKHGDTPEKGRFSSELGAFGAMYHARYWHEREFETVGKIQQIAEQQGTPMPTLSIAWVLANPAITSAILGASRLDHLTDTLAAADYQLNSTVKAQLDEVTIEYRRGDAGK